jgi:hypothetical protein
VSLVANTHLSSRILATAVSSGHSILVIASISDTSTNACSDLHKAVDSESWLTKDVVQFKILHKRLDGKTNENFSA